MMPEQTWQQWLRACSRDPNSPNKLGRGALAMLTGQDAKTLTAIAACWRLYGAGDAAAERAALEAIRALLPALQQKCWPIARELIAFALDWSDRDRLWPVVMSQIGPAQRQASFPWEQTK